MILFTNCIIITFLLLFNFILVNNQKYCWENYLQVPDNTKFYILLMLTDGVISDMKDTIDQLVIGSSLPLSVIIIGIGNANFNQMNILDADDNPLKSREGIQAARDLVHCAL